MDRNILEVRCEQPHELDFGKSKERNNIAGKKNRKPAR